MNKKNHLPTNVNGKYIKFINMDNKKVIFVFSDYFDYK